MPSLLLHETSLIVYETKRFEYFAKHCSLATWQRIVEQFPNHLESQQLQDSFKAWAQARMDAKFESQAELDSRPADCGIGPEGDCGDDCAFLVKCIESRPAGSEWITTW